MNKIKIPFPISESTLLVSLILTLQTNLFCAESNLVPKWIWPDRAQKTESVFMKKTFTLSPAKLKGARLQATCDNEFSLFLNGKPVLAGDDWSQNYFREVGDLLHPGKPNSLAVEARNQGGIGGFVLKLSIDSEEGKERIVTNETWSGSRQFFGKWKDPNFGDKHFKKVISLGKMGDAPWGPVFSKPQTSSLEVSSEPKVAKGFKLEMIYRVPKELQGSWVSICSDPQGKLIVSDQKDKGLFRIDPLLKTPSVEKLNVELSSAQGLLHAFGSLWVNVNGKGAGIYRLTDTNGDGNYDKKVVIKSLSGAGEHGPHALVLAPDGKHIYVVGGNYTKLPEMDRSRVPTNWGEDHLLKRLPDARGHAKNIRAPGGWIARFDKNGENWETIAMGFRNTYDMAFNVDGELFAYDSDMEWDAGTPWYRPTRFYHVISGADFGWRTGTGKWPQWYPDCVPPIYGIGPGSPVGVTSGLGSHFPAKYQKAIYCLDWTYGTMSAMHLSPKGSSYTATREEFVAGPTLRMTDATINRKDGAMYFTVGGRGGDSSLYRVSYVGEDTNQKLLVKPSANSEERKTRRRIESFHKEKIGAVANVWDYLGDEDRFIRWAARISLEHQPLENWQQRALEETNPQAALTALCALARQGDGIGEQVVSALNRFDLINFTKAQQLELLRVYQLVFIRMGAPDNSLAASVREKLDPYFPSPSPEINRELCTLLVYLESPSVIEKTLALLAQTSDQSKHDWNTDLLSRNSGYARAFLVTANSSPQREQIHLAKELRNLKSHWTKPQVINYFKWFKKAELFKGGNSFSGFLKEFRNEALENIPTEWKEEVEKIQTEFVSLGAPFEVDSKLEVGVLGQKMRFDKELLHAKRGSNLELTFTNNDTLPLMHNLLVVNPGKSTDIVAQAIALGVDGMAKSYVPQSDDVLAATPLVQIGNSYKIYLKVPNLPGDYEYVCTYPGHGMTMKGVLRVE